MKTSVRNFGLAAFAAMTFTCAASATLLNIDQVIYQSGTGQSVAGMTGTLDYTFSGNTATFVMTNTSTDAAFTDATTPAKMLLTGFGLQLGTTITGGTVNVTAGSAALNFDAGQTNNLGNQYLYANQANDGYLSIPSLTITNLVSSVNNGIGTRFIGAPPPTIDGPDYGALSAFETQFGNSQAGVQNSITFVLNLSGPAPSFADLNAGNVVLAFGSSDFTGEPPSNIPVADGGTTVILLGLALGAIAMVPRKLYI